MTKDWKELLRLFNEIGVEYCVVGSVALSWHGFPRYTGDMDLLVAPTEANAQRVLAALEQFGMTSLGLSESDFTNPDLVVQLGYPPCRIDLLTFVSGVSTEEVLAEAIVATMDGEPTRVICRDHLLINKLATGRSQDLADAERLRCGDNA